MAMKVVRQARLELSGGSTPDQLRPPPYTIANIHGPFTRDRRERLDTWLAQVTDLGVVMGDFNDSIWGRPSQPTRYWHQMLESGQLLDPVLAHAPDASPRNLATHTRGRRLDAIYSRPRHGTPTPRYPRTPSHSPMQGTTKEYR